MLSVVRHITKPTKGMPHQDAATAQERVAALVKKYEAELSSGRIKKYTEEDVKKGFILPLFDALGWDVANRSEVSSEEHIKSSGRVDYGFYLEDRPKFYVEAKSVKANIHDEQWARQAIRYSWNKGVTWAVLTNFERLLVFNAQDIKSSLHNKLLFDTPYTAFVERFDDLWLLSKHSLINNALDSYAERIGKKFERVPISTTLYKDLDECREILTRSLAAWNKEKFAKNPTLLDEGVQKLLDRLIFMRVAEDRGVEPPTLIPVLREWAASKNKNVVPLYEAMVSKFREFDATYNSNIFSKHPFESWEEYDGSTERVIKILYGKEGYYEYDFKVMPADVLGTVYENYLGHRLSQSKKKLFDEVELNKDLKKRKEHGIYYTPSFVVDYIVEHALRPVLDKCHTAEELLKVKVLDPACGSGSFLIKALEVLNEKYKSFGYEGDENTKLLILTHNIYGVDLDEQAVEIARLNLCINSLDRKIKLPHLDNIKCGNSLVSGTDAELKKYFGAIFRSKKPFNWREEFPTVFAQGGFDIVIGNPPYVNLFNIKDEGEREYLKAQFVTAKNKSDLYSFFAEKGIELLRPSGHLGFIFSNSWLGTDSFSKFREFLVENTTVNELVKLPPDVFADATVTTVLIFLRKEKAGKNHKISLSEYADGMFAKLPADLSYDRIRKSPGFNFSFDTDIEFKVPTMKLGDIASFSLGIKTSDDTRFISDVKKDESSHRLLRGKDVGRYRSTYAGKWIWYQPKLMMEKVGAGPRKLENFLRPKLLIKDVAQEITATYDNEQYLPADTLTSIYDVRGHDMKFILAILNSHLVNKWFKVHFPAGLHIKTNQMEHIPIPKANMEQQGKIAALVDVMLALNRELQVAEENSTEWERVKAEIEKADKKIEKSICTLYGIDVESVVSVGQDTNVETSTISGLSQPQKDDFTGLPAHH